MQGLQLSAAGQYVGGVMLLSIVTIEFGGWFLTRVVTGRVPMTEFQRGFARAGHAHAGVLVSLGLLGLLFAEATGLSGVLGWVARLGTPVGAILISAGFFFSSMGAGRTRPNRLISLVWVGAVALAAGVVTLGVGLLISAPAA
ncbi:hypothetical protein [Crossiella cryophila]|uniref:Integral membrane protein n=2 Tax=Crossiella cryophila TaxID=43355 RepID=A0A7W7CJI5_9PSEU|nr:hypothetical protein [Crossiella cryophila]MBB4682363.1 hypothetical protein [Crossiella cryophila]